MVMVKQGEHNHEKADAAVGEHRLHQCEAQDRHHFFFPGELLGKGDQLIGDELCRAAVTQHLAKNGTEEEDQEIAHRKICKAGHVRAGQRIDNIYTGEDRHDYSCAGSNDHQGYALYGHEDQEKQSYKNTDQANHCGVHTYASSLLY